MIMSKGQPTILNQHNVFSGPNAVKDFLDPDRNPPLPLVEIPGHLNPFLKDGVRIFAKLMNFLPLANAKSLPAYNMLLEREAEGKLGGVQSLIENSSGNTVFSLAVIGRLFGISCTRAIVSHEVTWGKLQLLRLFGVEILVNEEPICPDPADMTSGIHKARQVGRRRGWFNPGQYDNEANPAAHEKWTGRQIWEQTEGKITVFCAGLGTTGTMLGAGGYLKRKHPGIATVGVARLANNPVPGVRTPNLLREIAFDWRGVAEYAEEAGTMESFRRSLELCRAGIVAGPSSGFALQGLLQFIAKRKEDDSLEELRNAAGEVVAVFICPDSPFPYLNEYFEYLDDSHFPRIENEKLLINRPDGQSKKNTIATTTGAGGFEVDPYDAYEQIYSMPAKEIWRRLQEGEKISMPAGVVVVDIRSRGEFLHFHLPGSEQMDAYKITESAQKLAKKWKGKRVFLVCAMGVRTRIVAGTLRKNKIKAYSVRGGATEWSARNLPRWRPDICRI